MFFSCNLLCRIFPAGCISCSVSVILDRMVTKPASAAFKNPFRISVKYPFELIPRQDPEEPVSADSQIRYPVIPVMGVTGYKADDIVLQQAHAQILQTPSHQSHDGFTVHLQPGTCRSKFSCQFRLRPDSGIPFHMRYDRNQALLQYLLGIFKDPFPAVNSIRM